METTAAQSPTLVLPIDYGSDAAESQTERAARLLSGWTSLIWGGLQMASFAMQTALAAGWLWSPPNMRWGVSTLVEGALYVAYMLTYSSLVVGGSLALRRRRAGALIVRTACAVIVLVGAGSQVRSAFELPQFYDTPNTIVFLIVSFFVHTVLLPLVLIFLPLPPFRRRPA